MLIFVYFVMYGCDYGNNFVEINIFIVIIGYNNKK